MRAGQAIALEINYAATRMLIEIAKGYGVERFLFASSCSVYGATDALMDEHSQVHPISLYAETKVDSERVLLESRTAAFHPTILRLATVFGASPRPRFDLVVNLLAAKAYQDEVITIFNSEQWRPFIHVSDVAEGMLQMLKAPIESVSESVQPRRFAHESHAGRACGRNQESLPPGESRVHREQRPAQLPRVIRQSGEGHRIPLLADAG